MFGQGIRPKEKFLAYSIQVAFLIIRLAPEYMVTLGELLFNRDDDVTFDKRSSEYQNYLITREHKPSKVKRQFSEVRNKTRAEARTKQEKRDKVSNVKFIITYNPALPNINKIIQNNLSILHTGEDMKKHFPSN